MCRRRSKKYYDLREHVDTELNSQIFALEQQIFTVERPLKDQIDELTREFASEKEKTCY